MEWESLGIWSIALTVLLVTASAVSFAPIGTAAGNVENVENRPDAYAAEQGDRCIPVTMVGDGDRTVEEYYDYDEYDNRYSSQGTRDLQETGVAQLYVYRGERDDSLVFLNDETGDGAGGGALSIEVTSIPTEASWAVEDDDYDNQDDRFIHDGTTSSIDWKWYENRTDGAALLGLAHANDSGIDISASFGEDRYFSDWDFADNELSWRVRSPEDGLVQLNKDEPVTIRQGTCTDAPTANVTGSPSTVSTGENVTFDASESTFAGENATYRWDFNDNGSVERETDDPTTETAYNTTGTRTVRVTVVDSEGRTDDATTTVDVTSADPTAALSGPANATVNESVTFDASASTFEGDSATYRWDFNDNGSVERETTEPTAATSFETTGTQTVNVTVVDSEGRTDSATATVDVTSAAPTASLTGPANATVNESITFDASESSFEGDSATYRWEFNDNGSVEQETTEPTADTTFTTTGSRTVRVTVVDSEGRTDDATATIEVSEQSDTGPTAVLDAPANATVNESVTFDASESTFEGDSATYRWDFDDDGSVERETTEPTVEWTFDTVGTRTVGLTVADSEGRTNETTATVDVSADYELTTTVSANRTTVEPGETVAFTTNSTPATAVTDREFDFGDGDTASGDTEQPTHSFASAGEYEVVYTVTGEYGQTATARVAVTVESSGGNEGSSGGDSGGGGGGGDGGDSGGGGGGGGSFSLPSADNSDDAENGDPTAVTTTDSGVTIEVTDAVENDTVEVDLDDGTLGAGPIGVESITLTGVDSGTAVALTDERNGTSGPLNRSSETVFAVDPTVESGTSPSSIGYRLGVDSDAVRDAGGSLDAVTVATWNGSTWNRDGATVIENGSTAVIEPTVPVESMAVDVATASVVGRELTVDGVPARGQPVTVTTTMRNRGNRSVTETVDATLDGAVVASEQVTVPAGGSETVRMDIVPEKTGNQRLSVAGQSRIIDVAPASVSIGAPAVSVTNESVDRGDSVTVAATFTNTGTAPGTVNASFSAFGERIDRERVTVPAGESVTVRFSRRLEQTGEYSFTVNGEEARVSVGESESTTVTNETPSNTVPSIPAVLLVLGGMAGLTGTAVVLSRQFSTAD